MSFIPMSCEVSSFKDKMKAVHSGLSQGYNAYQNQYATCILQYSFSVSLLFVLEGSRVYTATQPGLSSCFLSSKGKNSGTAP
jgi:hypothetical protein